MEDSLKERLEEANKLIFVKQYEAAEEILVDLIDGPARDEILVHLRTIELATKLDKLSDYRRRYQRAIDSNGESWPLDICLAFVDLFSETVSPADSVQAFQAFIKKYGQHPASYFGIAFSLEAQGNYDRAIYNYKQSVQLDPRWYPSYFGLSQVYYHKGEESQGDHFFYLFEKEAPYNVYGNFETHRALSDEFFQRSSFADAEAAVQTLSEWWLEHRGHCPIEIQIFEYLTTARISDAQGDQHLTDTRKSRARALANRMLEDQKSTESVLYFTARVLEEFNEEKLAFRFYRKILTTAGQSPGLAQKVGGQFLTSGEIGLAKELFLEAYQAYPDNQEIRFCLLVSRLKLAEVNVEDYLIGKERLRQLLSSGGDKVETLALLHTLLAKFQEDPEIHMHIGDVYLKMGNIQKAGRHFHKMYELDSKGKSASLKYAEFVMHYEDPEAAMEILGQEPLKGELENEQQGEVFWLKSSYYARQRDYKKSQEILDKVLAIDPWNISYLVQEVINRTQLTKLDDAEVGLDDVVIKLSRNEENDLNWEEYDRVTANIEKSQGYALSYPRRKIRYLYSDGSRDRLRELVKTSCQHDPSRGVYDVIRLLNTNFDGPEIYWALGMLFKELWQLEAASLWLDQVLMYPGLRAELKAEIYIELADCMVWRGENLNKAVEYAKIAIEMGDLSGSKSFTVLAHAYLKKGEVRKARAYLEQAQRDPDPETTYLLGLLHYRNGTTKKAKEVWKPLLTVRSENLKFHHIKQELMRFYFDGQPYPKAN